MRGSAFASPSAISPVRSRLPSLTTTTCQVRLGIAESDATASSTVFAISSSSLYARKPTPRRTFGSGRGGASTPPTSRSAALDDPSSGCRPAQRDDQAPRVVDEEGLGGAASSPAPVDEVNVPGEAQHDERNRRRERVSVVTGGGLGEDAIDAVGRGRREARHDEEVVEAL